MLEVTETLEFDLRNVDSAEIRPGALRAAARIAILCDGGSGGYGRAMRFLSYLAPHLDPRSRIEVTFVGAASVANIVQTSILLESIGFLTVGIERDADGARIVLRRCADLEPDEIEVAFEFRDTAVRLAYPSAHDMLRRFALSGTFYEIDMLDCMKAAPQEGLFVDCGANIGNHSVFMARFAGRDVVAFEPNPPVFHCLKQNVERNGVADRVRLHPCGLGARAGWLECTHQTVVNSGDTRFRETTRADSGIPVVRLDDVEAVRAAKVALLKIDVEGMEVELLRGAGAVLAEKRPDVFIETKIDEGRAEVRAIMAAAGYRCVGSHNVSAEVLEFRPEERAGPDSSA